MSAIPQVPQAPILTNRPIMLEEQGPNWAIHAGLFALDNPGTIVKAAFVGTGLLYLAQWGVLGPLITAGSQPLMSGFYYGVPISPFSIAAATAASYIGYETGKEATLSLLEYVKANPIRSAVRLASTAYALYTIGMLSFTTTTVWDTATAPPVIGALSLGLGIDYVKACFNQNTLVGQETVKKSLNAIKEVPKILKEGKDSVLKKIEDMKESPATLQKIEQIQTFAKTVGTTLWNYPAQSTAIAVVAAASAAAAGFSSLATILAVGMVVPSAVFTYMKIF